MQRLLTEPLFYIYFVYGLSFLLMAVFLSTEITRATSITFVSSFWMLVFFGMTHGITEVVDWTRFIGKTLTGNDSGALLYISQVTLIASFFFLLQFAVNLMSYKSENRGVIRLIPFVLLAAFIAAVTIQGISDIRTIGLYSRYTFGFVGSALSALALFKLGATMKAIGSEKLVRGLRVAAIGFICYAAFGGLIVQPVFGMPVQLFRALCAVTITAATYAILDVFKVA